MLTSNFCVVGDDANLTLAELGLNADLLREAVIIGYVKSKSVTPNHPPNTPGLRKYEEIFSQLRGSLRAMGIGWKSDPNSHICAYNDVLGINIIVASADDAVGNPNKEPTTKSAKGITVARAIAANKFMADMFQQELDDANSLLNPQRETWFLLHHRDLNSSNPKIKLELSLPSGLSSCSYVNQWATRILLQSIPLDSNSVDLIGNNDPDPDPDYDVPVRLKI